MKITDQIKSYSEDFIHNHKSGIIFSYFFTNTVLKCFVGELCFGNLMHPITTSLKPKQPDTVNWLRTMSFAKEPGEAPFSKPWLEAMSFNTHCYNSEGTFRRYVITFTAWSKGIKKHTRLIVNCVSHDWMDLAITNFICVKHGRSMVSLLGLTFYSSFSALHKFLSYRRILFVKIINHNLGRQSCVQA